MCYINVSVDHAFPVKAKLLLAASLTIKVTFVNELSGLPIKKSSKEISAVSYYEKYQDLDFIMPIMTKPAIIDSDRLDKNSFSYDELCSYKKTSFIVKEHY